MDPYSLSNTAGENLPPELKGNTHFQGNLPLPPHKACLSPKKRGFLRGEQGAQALGFTWQRFEQLLYHVSVPKMRCHHSRIVVGGLGGQLHPSLGEKVPDGLQIAIGRRDAQKPALVNTEQGQDFGEMAALGTARRINSTCFTKSPGEPGAGLSGMAPRGHVRLWRT